MIGGAPTVVYMVSIVARVCPVVVVAWNGMGVPRLPVRITTATGEAAPRAWRSTPDTITASVMDLGDQRFR